MTDTQEIEAKVEAAGDVLTGICVRAIEASPVELPARYKLKFTGWKANWANRINGVAPREQYVAQWVLYTEGLATYRYVNLPGMETGTTALGGLMTIGAERVTPEIDPEKLVEMLMKGREKILEYAT